MHVCRHLSADSFFQAAQPWLMRAEAENNLILGIALALVRNPSIAKEPPYLATVLDQSDLVACALRSIPHKLVMSRASQEVASVLAGDAFSLFPTLDAVVGPEPSVSVFANAWSGLSGGAVRPGMRQRMYEIYQVVPSGDRSPGRLRPATDRDLNILTSWIAAFLSEARVTEKNDPAGLASERLKNGSLFVWEDRIPVSMAGWTGKTPNGVRVNLVYTPPELRRRGYATACVTALTQLLLNQGNEFCCLYTDLANPTSNLIYQRIGYRPLCDASDYYLTG